MAGFNELREKVYTVVRDSGRDYITEDNVDLWLIEGLEDLSSRLLLVQKSATGTISDDEIPIPSDFLDYISVKVPRSGSNDDYVSWTDNNAFDAMVEQDSDSAVTYARVFDGNIEIYPAADGTAYTLRYWATTSSDVAALRGSLRTRLVNYARSHAAYKDKDIDMGREYMAMYERGLPPPRNDSRDSPQLPSSIGIAGGPFDDVEARHV